MVWFILLSIFLSYEIKERSSQMHTCMNEKWNKYVFLEEVNMHVYLLHLFTLQLVVTFYVTPADCKLVLSLSNTITIYSKNH